MIDQVIAERRPYRRVLLAALLTLPMMLVAQQAPGAAIVDVPEPPDAYDTLLDAATQIDGGSASQSLGAGVVVGDFTCDGTTDIAMTSASGVQVLRGPVGGLPPFVDLAGPLDGFRIADSGSISVDAVGDVNGDGCDDLLVPGPTVTTYVIFGKTDHATVVPSALGAGGFVITARSNGSGARRIEGAGAGDVNGDGLDDIVMSDFHANSAYVVFGKANTIPVDLASLGSGGYPIVAKAVDSVSGAGDVNRDGRPDLLLAASSYDGPAGADTGAAWVVFGKANTTPMDVTSLGSAGYRIQGGEAHAGIGRTVANAGDVNGDGVPDQLIGRYLSDLNRGGVYVVFGKSSSTKAVRLKPTGFRGYQIVGPAGSNIGWYALVGDFDANADGRADQLIGAPYSDAGGRAGAGSAWVVYGQASKDTINLDFLTGGYRIDGPAADAELGRGAATVPGAPAGVRVVVGAWHTSANGRFESGATFVVGERSSLPTLVPPLNDLEYRAQAAGAGTSLSDADLAVRSRGQRLRVRATFTAPATVRVAVARIADGRRAKATSATCKRGMPRRPALACRRLQPVVTRSVTVPTPGRRAATLPKILKGGRYLVRTWATAGGRTFGPYTATVSVRR